ADVVRLEQLAAEISAHANDVKQARKGMESFVQNPDALDQRVRDIAAALLNNLQKSGEGELDQVKSAVAEIQARLASLPADLQKTSPEELATVKKAVSNLQSRMESLGAELKRAADAEITAVKKAVGAVQNRMDALPAQMAQSSANIDKVTEEVHQRA